LDHASPGAPAPGATALFWRQLIALIEQRRVIPVIGPDAVVIEDENGARPLTEHIARQVEINLGLSPSPAEGRMTLNGVACRCMTELGGQIGELYAAVHQVLTEHEIPVPEPLKKLARIRGFNLYVTTTFDDLLKQAIDLERFAGTPRTDVLAYRPDDVKDIPAEPLTKPLVYHLLGRVSALPEFCVTEEDTLEYIHSLQSPDRSPTHLLDALQTSTPLFIGNHYSDWLARFFLRSTRRERFLVRPRADIVADSTARDDPALKSFLKIYSAQTKVFAGGALEFIDELSMRWEAHQAGGDAARVEEAVPEEEHHAIFISYAHEDFERAKALALGLRDAKLPVWFDKVGGLEGGDDYEKKIRERIFRASLFVPVLSANVLTADRRFFRKEWKAAAEVFTQVRADLKFILPVCLDGFEPGDGIDEAIRTKHWLPWGADNLKEIILLIRDSYKDYQRARASA
jgi:hypothetical protein